MKTKSKKKKKEPKINPLDFRGRLRKLNENMPKPEKGSREEGIDALIQDMLQAINIAGYTEVNLTSELNFLRHDPEIAMVMERRRQIQLLEARIDVLEHKDDIKDYNDSYH